MTIMMSGDEYVCNGKVMQWSLAGTFISDLGFVDDGGTLIVGVWRAVLRNLSHEVLQCF